MAKRLLALLFMICLINFGVSDNVKASSITNYQDIPGVTKEDIANIEKIQAQYSSLSFGGLYCTELFERDGVLKGFAPKLCELLTQLFGIQFKPEIMTWEKLYNGISDHSIDFAGNLTRSPERLQKFFMSEPIAARNLTFFRLKNAEPLSAIASDRPIKIAYLANTIFPEEFRTSYAYPMELVVAENRDVAIQSLESHKIDALLTEWVADAYFLDRGTIVSEPCNPYTYNSVSLTTGNPELAPIITVFNKYLLNGGDTELVKIYANTKQEYSAFKFSKSLTEEERNYLNDLKTGHQTVKIGLESDNYPKSFYNETEKEFQGVVVDLLHKISTLTGIEFEAKNEPHAPFKDLLASLQSGEISVVSELLYNKGREDTGYFLWADDSYWDDIPVIISLNDFPDIEPSQILNDRVGITTASGYEYLFSSMFPFTRFKKYDSTFYGYDALRAHEIDLFVSTESSFLSQNNYYRNFDFKINVFMAPDTSFASSLGFNKNETVLKSIMDKAQAEINTSQISKEWGTKIFDYSSQISAMKITLLVITVVFLLLVSSLLFVLVSRSRKHSRDLETLVGERTEKLSEKTSTLTAIYDSIPDLIFCKDTNGNYTSCNPGFEKFAGCLEHELLGKSDTEVFKLDVEMAKLFREADQVVFESDKPIVVEELCTYPNGNVVLFETLKAPLYKDNHLLGIIGIARDMTKWKENEEAAQAAARAKGEFLARMSHEIRTPLNVVIGMAHIAEKTIDDKERALTSIHHIVASSNHLLGIINDILDMSKIDSGKLELISEPFNLSDSLDEIFTIITPSCQDKNITFETNHIEAKNLVVMGDKLRLNQVILNLLSNAVKFTKADGSIKFSLTRVDDSNNSATLKFVIQDSGIGMSEAQMKNLFKVFEQADSTIASRFGGTGLGLAISQSLINAMNGQITVTSLENIGSTFQFVLVFEKSELAVRKTDFDQEQINWLGKRILLVEDIPINAEIVCSILEDTQISIELAANGQEAVDMFEKSEIGYYNLILMDVQMPIMDGYQATTCIRNVRREDAKRIPIIAMTANAYKEDIDKAISVGMNSHLSKPINVNEVFIALQAVL